MPALRYPVNELSHQIKSLFIYVYAAVAAAYVTLCIINLIFMLHGVNIDKPRVQR